MNVWKDCWKMIKCLMLFAFSACPNILHLRSLTTFAQFHWKLGIWSFLKSLIQKELVTIFAPFQPLKLFAKVYWICFRFILKCPYSQRACEAFWPFSILSPLFTPCLSVPMYEKAFHNGKPPQHPTRQFAPNFEVFCLSWCQRQLKVSKHILPLVYWLQPLTHLNIN